MFPGVFLPVSGAFVVQWMIRYAATLTWKEMVGR